MPSPTFDHSSLFGRVDFTHARLSMLILLPLCSLFSVYLAELKSLPLRRALASSPRITTAALGIVLVAAVLSWMIHGPLIDYLVPLKAFQVRPYEVEDLALGMLRRDHTVALPVAVVRVVLTAAILTVILSSLLYFSNYTFDGRIAIAIIISTFAFVETITYAHFKVNGAHTWTYPLPFGTFNYMNVLPSVMSPPTEEALKEFDEKLEVEHFRSVLVSGTSLFYPGAKTGHISPFWHARMIGGYGTGLSRRLADLPWPEGVLSLRTIELRSMSDVHPDLLALLNVKYILVATADFYFNVALRIADGAPDILTLGGVAYPGEVISIDGVLFGLITNSATPLPRHFLVEKITGVQETPKLQGAMLEVPAAAGEKQDAPGEATLVRERVDQLTRHSLAEDFIGTQTFDNAGPLDIAYHGDVIDVHVGSSARSRFLVINERYHPKWRARVGAAEIPIFPTNAVMLGVLIPPDVDRIQLRFEPFSSTWQGHSLRLVSVLVFIVATGVLWNEPRLLRSPSPGQKSA